MTPVPNSDHSRLARKVCDGCGGFGVHGVLDIETKCRDCKGRGWVERPALTLIPKEGQHGS